MLEKGVIQNFGALPTANMTVGSKRNSRNFRIKLMIKGRIGLRKPKKIST
jgi:hypothetical protein